MGKIKSGIRGLILLVIASSALFLTCDIGLGRSVDTKPPTLTIAYPPVQSIIKNSFTMTGKASDDTSLASVSVTALNTVTKASFGPYAATVDPKTNEWSLVVNKRVTGGFELRDGSYQLTATATDGAGRKSVATTTYEIDNTAPVVVIDRPGTYGPIVYAMNEETGRLEPVNTETYGTELKVTGSINDDHAIDKLVFTTYDKSGNPVGKPITQTNISGVAMDITLARFSNAPTTAENIALNNVYRSIYTASDGSSMEFYCTITASDAAREYNPPAGTASADNTRGNVNSSYYIYDDIYSTIFAATGYAATMKDLTAMFNGSYADTAKASAVLSALAAKARPAAVWSTASASFSLNPKNNPTFKAQGYEFLATPADIDLPINQIADNSDLTLMISPGRDNVSLDPASFAVSIVPCGPSGSTPSGDPAIPLAINDLSSSGKNYLATVTVDGESNVNYILSVTGTDMDGKPIDNGAGFIYGFKVVINGLPPTISVATPTLNSYTSATTGSHTVTLSGSVTSENGAPTLMLSGYTETKVDGTKVTIVNNALFDKANPATYVTIPVTPSGEPNKWNWSYTIDTTHNLSAANGGNGEDLYTYDVILNAKNLTNTMAQTTHVFFVDSARPTAELVSVAPTVSTSPPPYCVNGIVAVTLRFADNDRIASASYRLGSDPVQTILSLNGYTVSGIDTRNYDVSGTGMLPLTVTLTDRAGLQTVYKTNDAVNNPDWVVNIDQSLDDPTLTVNYANAAVTAPAGINATTNLYGRDGYTAINGTVSDDDGPVSVTVTVDNVPHAATVTGSTYSYDLSGLSPGYHDVRITATDTALGASTSIPGPGSTFMIAYDTDLPSIAIDNADNQFQPGALHITGTVSDSSLPLPATPIASFVCSPSGPTVNYTAPTWSVDIAKPAASEVTTLTFIAKDVYGRTATKAFTYKYDLDSPTITVTTALAGQPARNFFNQNYALTIKGTAQEAASPPLQSGLAGIQYYVRSGLNAALPATPAWLDATGSASWVANVDLTDAGTYPDGDYTVFLRSLDLMGNASAPRSYTVTGDRVAPTLTETEINTSNTVYKPATFDIGGEISDARSGLSSFSYTRNGSASINAMGLINVMNDTWRLTENDLADGTYSYVFTAKDNAGISSTVTRTVTIDKTKPVIVITSPTLAEEGAYIKADSHNFKGTATDTGSSVSTINLTINGVSTAISPVTNWTTVQDLTALTEGTTYTALLEVTDNAGNAETATRTFKVDRADPRATIVPGATAHGFVDSSVFYREAAFTLSGTCDDAAVPSSANRKATSVVLTRSKDGGVATTIASTVVADGKPFGTDVIADQTWSYSQTVDAASHLDDGLYVYTLVVTDDAGRAKTATVTVRIDTTAPTVIVTAPTANESVNVAAYTLQGNASDLGAGIDTATLRYTLDGGPSTALSLSGATWTAASVNLGAEGSKALTVSCADRLGNAITPINVTFYYDLNKPELEETALGTSTRITKDPFSLGGTCLDTNQMKQIDISATRQGVPAATKTWTWPAILRSEKNNVENWTQNVALTDLDYASTTDGTYTFTIVATDIAGKTTTVQRTVIVDTVQPVISAVTSLIGGWLRNSTHTVTGTITDTGGSGIDTVKYAIVTDGTPDTEPWYSMTVSGTTFTGSVSFPDGANYELFIRGTDRAGNYREVQQGVIRIDTMAPSLTVDTPVGVKTINGKSDLQIVVAASDSASGPGTVSASFTTDTDPYNAPDTWSVIAGLTIASNTPSAGKTTITVPASSLASLAEGSQKVYLRVPDAAGNYSTVATVNLLVDKTGPTGSVSSHGDSATVNKTITFSGTANDVNGVASVSSLEVWTGGAGAADPDPEATTGWTAAGSGVVAGTYSWSVSSFNTVPYSTGFDARSNLPGEQVCVRVAVTDSAGNIGHIMHKFTVDQDTDKPIVKLTNLATTGSPTLIQTKVIYGTISDDDGSVTSLAMKSSSSDSLLPVPIDGQSFTYTVTGSDGSKQLYFQITDKAGTTFTTAAVSSATTPRLYQAADTYLETPLSFNLDTTPPDIGSDSIGIKVAGKTVYSAYSSTNAYYGGTASGSFNVQFMASSANTVASASVAITDSASTTTSISATLGAPVSVTVDVGSDTLTASASHGLIEGTRVFFTGTPLPGGLTANVPYYVISTGLTSTAFKVSASSGGSPIDITSAGTAVHFTTGWTTTDAIDITALASGAATLSITTTDGPGLSTTTSKTILIDNFKPAISVTSHSLHEQVTGDVVFNGTSDDGTGSGVSVVMYHVGKCADLNATTWTTLTTQLSWAINFTSATNNVITTDATYANATYADETSPGSNVWILPIYLRAVDKAGNVQDYPFYLNVDPNGDKPTATVSYPANGTTLGGNIRIFGSATDNVSVASVWMEIDTNNDGEYNATDIAALVDAGYGTAAEVAEGFKIEGTASWSKTINGSDEFNAPDTVILATSITSGVRYKIVSVDGTNFMALGATANTPGVEFTANASGASSVGTGTVTALTNLIRFRVRACDDKGTYGTWSSFRTIKIDNKAPKIGSTIPLKLVQYTDGTLTTVAAEQSYVSNMYIRGEWYLVGSVDDESGIKAISVSESAVGTIGTKPNWFIETTTVGSYHNYTFRIPVGKALSDTSCGAQTYKIYVEDASDPTGTTTQSITLNYDNKAPVPAILTHGGSAISATNLVVQSNNAYTFASTVTEDGSSDSGFNRLVFFFVRQKLDGSNKRVYNPMLPIDGLQPTNDVKGNRTYLSNLTWEANDVPRLDITGADRSGGEDKLTHSSIVGNYNVRVGGLVRIAGVDRLIKSVDRTAGTIAFSPSVSTSYTTASLLYGLVVDNTVVEIGQWTGSTLTTITNDDGDGMVESVVKSGGTWTWDASVDSKNIPDGPIYLYYVAYDKAGNTISGYVQSAVANSGPRIAKIRLGTDLSGDSAFNTAEVSTVYTATLGSEPTRVDLTDQTFKMKGDLAVIPEFVGGNGTLQYVWTANAAGATAWDGTTYRSTKATTSDGTLTSFPGVTVSGTSYPYGLTLSAANASVTAMNGALKLFSFTVWDSTDETTIGVNSQWALINVPIRVAVTDVTAPNAIIDPFYWASLASNSVYGTSVSTTDPSTLSGHIELPADLSAATFNQATGVYDLDPKVSGKITITGSAYDDQRLDSLWVTFDGFTPAAGTYLDFRTDVGDGKTYYKIASFNTSTSDWTYAGTLPAMATHSYTFTVTPDYLTQAGHRVTWKLCIDTAKITGAAAADTRVRVVAYDHGTLPSPYNSVVAGTNVPYYQMDVVPYIKGVKTSLSTLKKTVSSVYDRTALGHYPVKSDQSAYFYGFNLAANATVSDSATTPHTTTLGTADTAKYSGYTVYPATIATFKSGSVRVTVNGVVSLNNQNANDAKGSYAGTTSSATGDYGVYSNYYNRQPNNDNNNTLTDDVVLDVWKVKNSARSHSGTLTEPIMRIVPTATDTASVNDVMRFAFTNGADFFSMASAGSNQNSYQDWQRNYADFNNVAFTYDNEGNSYGIVTGLDTYPSTTTTFAGRLTFVSSRWGVCDTGSRDDNYYGLHKLRLESIGIIKGAYVQGSPLTDDYIMDTRRFSSPSLTTAIHGTGNTSVYFAYYDKFQKQVRFRYGTFNPAVPNKTDSAHNTVGNFGQFLDQHGQADTNNPGGAYYHDNKYAFDAAITDYSLIAGMDARTNADTGNTAGKYVAIDVVPGATTADDVVVAVWYDGSNLKYSYIVDPYSGRNADQSANAGTTGYWSIPKTIFTDGGKYCAIKVDPNGGIHIAAQDNSNQDLKYAYLSGYNAAYSETTGAVTVDAYAIVGTQIHIDTQIEGGKVIPYISYYNGSTMKPKMAYLVPQTTMDYTASGADSTTERLTGKWEVTLVPTSSEVQDDHMNIGLWRTTAGVKRVNVQTGTDSIGSPSGYSYGNGTANPVVGYATVVSTQGYIETAQMQ
jgi:hypothetical protein